jgi:inner membrane protein
LQAQGLASHQLLVTPAPFNTVLWRVVSLDGERFHEGFYSFMDDDRALRFVAHDRGSALAAENVQHPQLQRLMQFTDGFFKIERTNGRLVVTDLRMGQEPAYVFAFDIGPPLQAGQNHEPAKQQARQLDLGAGLIWLWQRILGRDVAPPGSVARG